MMPKSSRQARRKANKDAREQERLSAIRQEVERELEAEPSQNHGAVEASGIQSICDELHLALHEIQPDGHCMYNAVADQLNVRYPAAESYTYKHMRKAAASYMAQHPDDFLPFISELDESAAGVESSAQDRYAKFQQYCDGMESSSAWGGQPELLALANVLSTPIHVFQAGMPVVQLGEQFADRQPLTISYVPALTFSYHVRMYGLGEHYNSLRPADAQPTPPPAAAP